MSATTNVPALDAPPDGTPVIVATFDHPDTGRETSVTVAYVRSGTDPYDALDEIRERQAQYFACLAAYREAFDAALAAEPRPEREPSEDVPKWPKGIRMQDITPEMRAERDVIRDRNEVRRQSYLAADAARTKEAGEAAHRAVLGKHPDWAVGMALEGGRWSHDAPVAYSVGRLTASTDCRVF